ncbi:hypothetical protein SISNIDRAFT_485824 [Sistotremastrum niveocremeum HHB9708]|uniref:Uncharacterized protein n=1 Tax=Sistotremastrum niveocremeum HHB9708 TaxID=1314777 RepID=A0A164UW12_9AGAM|nr:hypothetical protein SISNIDRAFT_485824 [Sistotremastrum niveocremeum HHB9708]
MADFTQIKTGDVSFPALSNLSQTPPVDISLSSQLCIMEFKGKIPQMKKPELVALANAWGCSAAGTVPVLKERLLAHQKDNPALAFDPRFAGLYTYRPGSDGSKGAMAKHKEPGRRTSATKDREDQEADQGPSQGVVSLKTALQTLNITSDPPGTKAISAKSVTPVLPQNNNANDLRSGGSRPSSPLSSAGHSPEPEVAEVPGDKVSTKDKELEVPEVKVTVVRSTLIDISPGLQAPPIHTFVENVAVKIVQNKKGEEGCAVQLSEFVPSFLDAQSPRKTSGRLFARTDSDEAGFLPIGKIEDYLQGHIPKALSLPMVNEHKLVGHCDADRPPSIQLYYSAYDEVVQPTAPAHERPDGLIQMPVGPIVPVPSSNMQDFNSTAAGKMPKLHEEGAEALSNAENKAFLEELQAKIGFVLEKRIGVADTIGARMRRWKQAEELEKKLMARFGKVGEKGFIIRPQDGMDRWTGRTFTKDCIHQILGCGKTTISGDRSFFTVNAADRKLWPEFVKWFTNPAEHPNDEIAQMSAATLNSTWEEKRARRDAIALRKEKSSKRSRRGQDYLSDEPEVPAKKRNRAHESDNGDSDISSY